MTRLVHVTSLAELGGTRLWLKSLDAQVAKWHRIFGGILPWHELVALQSIY